MQRKKYYLNIFLIIILLIVLSEIILRTVYGFTDTVLFREDKDYEYIPIPQERFRFRNTIFYNSFSQRNDEISSKDSIICLGFGDSIINGGAQTDQKNLATELLSDYLTKKYKTKVLFTNISAGSWGPDNGFAYLNKFGSFGSKNILLLVSSHDAYDNMNFEIVVDAHPSYPTKQYQLAIFELLDRYVYERYIKDFLKEEPPKKNDIIGTNKQKIGIPFNNGFDNFKNFCDSADISLKIYLHADKKEFKQGKYNKQGEKIIKFCKANKIKIIKELDYNFPEDAYRDDIHLSEKGQEYLFEVLKNYY